MQVDTFLIRTTKRMYSNVGVGKVIRASNIMVHGLRSQDEYKDSLSCYYQLHASFVVQCLFLVCVLYVNMTS